MMDISFSGENVFARGSVIGDLFIVTPKRGAHKALEIVKKRNYLNGISWRKRAAWLNSATYGSTYFNRNWPRILSTEIYAALLV